MLEGILAGLVAAAAAIFGAFRVWNRSKGGEEQAVQKAANDLATAREKLEEEKAKGEATVEEIKASEASIKAREESLKRRMREDIDDEESRERIDDMDARQLRDFVND